MESLVININSEEEKKFITQPLSKLGTDNISIEEYEFQKRVESRKKFAEFVRDSPKIDITDDDVKEEVSMMPPTKSSSLRSMEKVSGI